MKRIIAENPDYHIIYRCEINAVILHIKVNQGLENIKKQLLDLFPLKKE